MSQHDYDIANADGATVRADLNSLFDAIATQNSGDTAPTTTFAFMPWLDTSNSLLKVRNSANNAWVTVASLVGSTWIPYSDGAALVAVATSGDGADLAANSVTAAQMEQIAAHSFVGNNTAALANRKVLTATEATAELDAVVGDSGSGGTKGLVPAPAAGDAAANKFLKASGAWSALPAAGVTSVATGTGLTGGPITGTGTISMDTTAGNVGTYMLAGYKGASTITFGTTVAGSNLEPTTTTGVRNGTVPSGTWRCMGYIGAIGCGTTFSQTITLWQRIA